MGAAALIALLATPAAIAAPTAATLTAVPPATKTVTYGQGWALEFSSTESLEYYEVLGIEVTGLPAASEEFGGFGFYSDTIGNAFQLYTSGFSRVIPIGTYSVGVNVNAATSWSGTLVRATTAVPHTLVIQPAPLSVSVRATPDSADPQNTVISMSLQGSWLEDVACCQYRTDWGRANLDKIPAPPAGTWTITIANAAGEILVDEQFDQLRGTVPAEVYLWRGAPLNELSTVTVTFTPTGDEARNFVVTQSEPVAFTTGAASRPEIVLPSIPDGPPAEVRTGVGVPVWLLALLALLGLGTGAAGVVLAVRANKEGVKRGSSPAESTDAHDLADNTSSARTDSEGSDVNPALNAEIEDSASTVNPEFGSWSLSSSDGASEAIDSETKNER
jgi:hypothetical protein